MKLDFEITVDQQTKAHYRTFEAVTDFGCPRDSHALIWSTIGSILPNHLTMRKTILVAILGICNKYDRFWPIDWANINIFE